MHEAWHRIQPQLGLSTNERVQHHLTTLDGGLSMRLELRALQQAVALNGDVSREAFNDALIFRSWRYAKFTEARTNEAALEANEGLAEYTGWKVSGAILDEDRLVRHLARGEQATTLARNFAYFTGPAYGVLLDRFSPGWRVKARAGVALPLDHFADHKSQASQAFLRAGSRYGYAQILSEERRAEGARRQVEARWRSSLVDGPTLTIPMQGANIVFDPNSVHPLPQGNVYSKLQAKGPWGSLDAQDGALVSSDWSALTVTAKHLKVVGRIAEAAGWRMELIPGWSVQGKQGRRRLVQSDRTDVSRAEKR